MTETDRQTERQTQSEKHTDIQSKVTTNQYGRGQSVEGWGEEKEAKDANANDQTTLTLAKWLQSRKP